jgi:hypothetical protein
MEAVGETFRVGQEIISVEYRKDEDEEYSWYFGGFINSTTIVINIISANMCSPFYYQVKIGDTITLPEFIYDDIAKLQYEIIALHLEKNELTLLEK